jgi:hypothetical protein
VSEEAQTIDTTTQIPMLLTVAEVQGVLFALRKLPMEQAEALVYNIQTQANTFLQNMTPKEKTSE